ncbi:hypothetical protein LCGC14_0742360 [marine sediment metagenome]|uniref:Uncharacterized protein n=1 Tax=marine sediment metagenome TaxID=412755 RepID=A0A0F9TDE3_9ZZZZ
MSKNDKPDLYCVTHQKPIRYDDMDHAMCDVENLKEGE